MSLDAVRHDSNNLPCCTLWKYCTLNLLLENSKLSAFFVVPCCTEFKFKTIQYKVGNKGNIGNMLAMQGFQAVASFFSLGQQGQQISVACQLLPFAFSLGQHAQSLYL